MEQATKKGFFPHINLSEELDLLSEIEIPKKYHPILDRIKTGFFTKNITNAEKKLMGQKFNFQLDVFNTPANNSYQKELDNTMKKIAKISGISEIEQRLRVLKMMLLLSFDEFEASVKQLNDDRKEIELKIRELKEATPKKPIIEEVKKLEEKRYKTIELIKNAPKRDIYIRRKQLLEERIEKYHKEIYKLREISRKKNLQ